jgi:hypothetical protein
VFWALVGGDSLSTGANGFSRILTTGATGSTFTNGQITNANTGSNLNNLTVLFNPAVPDAGLLSVSATSGAPSWMNTNGLLGINTLTGLGQGASLFYSVRSQQTGPAATAANTTEFGNAAGMAVVTLALDGTLTYTLAPEAVNAVPVPAAVWLMGSGLAAFGGMVRRRKTAAQA